MRVVTRIQLCTTTSLFDCKQFPVYWQRIRLQYHARPGWPKSLHPSHGANTQDQEPFICPGTSNVPDIPSAATTRFGSDGEDPNRGGGLCARGALETTMNDTLYGIEYYQRSGDRAWSSGRWLFRDDVVRAWNEPPGEPLGECQSGCAGKAPCR